MVLTCSNRPNGPRMEGTGTLVRPGEAPRVPSTGSGLCGFWGLGFRVLRVQGSQGLESWGFIGFGV